MQSKGDRGCRQQAGGAKSKRKKEIGLLKGGPNRSGLSEPDRFGIAYK